MIRMYRLIKSLIGLAICVFLVITFLSSYKNYKGKYSKYAEPIDKTLHQAADYVEKLSALAKDKLDDMLGVQKTEGALEEVLIERVVDGDTVIIIDSGGNSYRVRLIGVDTPESVNPDESKNTEEGVKASDYTKSRLLSGNTVYLEYDKEKTDPYGRILAYLWLTNNVDTSSINDIQTKMYNAELIVEGYAVPKVYEPNTKYADIFEEIYKNTR